MKTKYNPEQDELNEDYPHETAEQNIAADEPAPDETAPQTEDAEAGDWQEKFNEQRDKNLRLMAEFDNYRKRTLKEKADIIKNAGERIFSDMLPLIDDFDRAMQAMNTAEDIDAVKEGITLIYDKFVGFLHANGVTEIPTENADFDVDRHEAITTFPAADKAQKGKIIDCVSKGYTLNDKVIRYPKVVVGE